jgi:hypothetical protein
MTSEGTIQGAPNPEGFAWLENDGLRQLPDKRLLQLVSRCDAIVRSSRIGVSAQMLGDVRCEILAEAMHAATSVDQDLHSDRVRAGTEPVTRLRQGPETRRSLLLRKALLLRHSGARF